MEEVLITFETSKLAKDKRLIKKGVRFSKNTTLEISGNIECKYSYNKDGVLITPKYLLDEHNAAPTQSLLQKWIRKVHKVFIGIDISVVSTGGKEGYRYTWYSINLNNLEEFCSDETPLGYLIYEEALEAGLQQVLKLIK